MKRYEEIWRDLSRSEEIWWDMKRPEEIWRGMKRYDKIWNDMKTRLQYMAMARYHKVWQGMARYGEANWGDCRCFPAWACPIGLFSLGWRQVRDRSGAYRGVGICNAGCGEPCWVWSWIGEILVFQVFVVSQLFSICELRVLPLQLSKCQDHKPDVIKEQARTGIHVPSGWGERHLGCNLG